MALLDFDACHRPNGRLSIEPAHGHQALSTVGYKAFRNNSRHRPSLQCGSGSVKVMINHRYANEDRYHLNRKLKVR